MLDTSTRLLRLLALLQSRRYWSGPDLAARLEVTRRTLRRDVDRLRSLGYPVESSGGVGGGYALGTGAALPPLLLDDDEALAVALGLRMAATGTISGLGEAAVRALAKLELLLPTRLRAQVRGLHAAVAPLGMAGPAVEAERLVALAAACRDSATVRFAYRTVDGRGAQREAEPHALVCAQSRWYLLAWDRQREDWRTFRVDRIDGGIAAGARFAPRPIPGGDAAAYVARSVSTAQYPTRARIVLHAPLERMAERIPPLGGQLQRLDETRCLLVAGAHEPEALALYVGWLGVEFEVLEPPEVARALSALAARLARAAARAGVS